MKKLTSLLCAVFLTAGVFAQGMSESEKLKMDREAIKGMEGCYKVTFEFAETFSPDTSYEYHDRTFSWGIEYAFIIEETEDKISLQHLLIVNDTMIIKHWRQDWVYEEQDLLSYHKDGEWKKIHLSPEEAEGTWTQKVYQVDDSPRYEGYGSWVHVDGRHFWESTADAPLPRRDLSRKKDYNVLKRFSHIELTDYGWILEQDNQKILRENGEDKLITWEKGFEKFIEGEYNCQPGISWWEENKQYWSDVREVWDEVYAENEQLKFHRKIDGKILFQKLFSAGDKYANSHKYNSKEVKKEVREVIDSYLIKG